MNNKISFYHSRIWKVLSLLAVILWGTVIFAFSSQDADASGTLSWKVDYKLVDKFNKLQSDSDKIVLDEVLGFLDHLVRKGAHIAEYGFFAMLVFHMLIVFGVAYKKCYGITLPTVFVYASLDEIHQLFSEGRSAQVSDVMVDTFGGILALLMIALAVHIYQKRKNRLEKKK